MDYGFSKNGGIYSSKLQHLQKGSIFGTTNNSTQIPKTFVIVNRCDLELIVVGGVNSLNNRSYWYIFTCQVSPLVL